VGAPHQHVETRLLLRLCVAYLAGLLSVTAARGATRTVNVGQGGGLNFVDTVSLTSTTTINVGDTVHWVWISGFHSTTSGTCSGICTADGIWDSKIGRAHV